MNETGQNNGTGDECTRQSLQALTRDELRELLKVHNITAGVGINKRTKEGVLHQLVYYHSMKLMYIIFKN